MGSHPAANETHFSIMITLSVYFGGSRPRPAESPPLGRVGQHTAFERDRLGWLGRRSGLLPAALVMLCFLPLVAARDIWVHEHGAVGDGVHDDGPALRAVFAAVSQAREPTTIHFAAGKTYLLASPAEGHGRLLLHEARQVTVDGHGATILVRPPNRALGLYRSQDVVVRHLIVDYHPLPYIQGTITRIDNANAWLEFRPQAGYGVPVEGDSSLYGDGRNEDCVTFNRETRQFYHAHSRISRVAKLEDGSYRVSYRAKRFTAARAGDLFAMKHRWGERLPWRLETTDEPARRHETISEPDPSLSIVHSDRVRIENVRSLAAPGMTLNARGCRELVIDGLVIERVGDRLVAGNSDGIHVKGTESPPVIRNCRMEGTMDDSIHVKISGDCVREVSSPRRVRIQHMDIAYDNTNLSAGRSVLVYDHARKRQLGLRRIVQYEPIDARGGWVTLESDVPGMNTGNSLYLMAEGEAVIEDCTFNTQLQRAILTHQPTLIRRCEVNDTGQGIVVSFGGIEGPPSQRIRVEDCTFRNLTVRALTIACPSLDYDQGGAPQFIATGNRFFLPPGVPALQVRNSQGVALIDNVHHHFGPAPKPADYIILINSPLGEDRGNRFAPVP
jgi:hypothetical protein